MKTTQELIQIVANGGSLDLRNVRKTTQELVQIAANAANSGARVVIRGDKTTQELVQIAANGRGCVTIYFDD